MLKPITPMQQRGTTLFEVLVTIVILAFGLLGLAGFQTKVQLGELESYQRAQALLVLSDMTERLNANRAQAASYVSATVNGTSDAQPASCTALALGAARDVCEWSNALKGNSETKSGSSVGTMQGGRGCITEIQTANPATGICTPGIYRVTVAWQGAHRTAAPALTCGQGSYGSDDAYRRAISADVTVGLPTCY